MAEAVVTYLLSNLGELLTDRVQLYLGLDEEIDWIKCEFESIQAFLRDADQRAAREESVKVWVKQVRDVVYDVEDVLDKFSLRSAKQLQGSSRNWLCGHVERFKGVQEVAIEIRKIKARIEEISKRRLRYQFQITQQEASSPWNRNGNSASPSFPLVPDVDGIVGLDEDAKSIERWILDVDSRLTLISFAGMGGIGKTTLAKKVYNSEQIKRSFECQGWVHVSQSFHVWDLLQEMVKGIMGSSIELENMNEGELARKLYDHLEDKRYIIVLDDVWDTEVWERVRIALPEGHQGSRVILTTRKMDVATPGGITNRVHALRVLSDEESWMLFCKKAFQATGFRSCPPNLQGIGDSIVKKCRGLPLAIVVMGALLSRKPPTEREWQKVLENHNWETQAGGQVLPALSLSYQDLPFYLKSCFKHSGIFPEDFEIPKTRLIRLWVAEGFIEAKHGETMEDLAEGYLEDLVSRSMLQVGRLSSTGRIKTCLIHDLLRELSVHFAEKENFSCVCEQRELNIPPKTRRISMQQGCENFPLNINSLYIRSLLVFGKCEGSSKIADLLAQGTKLLRVLDLEGLHIQSLPNELGNLIHLRYLGLRKTKIKKFPDSLSKLSTLQTLDLRETYLKLMPSSLFNVKCLRHLQLPYMDKQMKGVHEICNTPSILTLTGLYSSIALCERLGMLTQLRKLGLNGVGRDHEMKLCSSLNKLDDLYSLTLYGANDKTVLQLKGFSPPRFLTKLSIVGVLEKLPEWSNSLHYLTKLTLVKSKLSDDPFVTLEHLPELQILSLLQGSFVGKVIKCSNGGFPNLQSLKLWGLSKLEVWKLEVGAIPCLTSVSIYNCPNFKMLPEGLQQVSTLRELHLIGMPEKFKAKVRNNRSQDWYKVKNISSLNFS
ncbi:hypothetical protein AMTRI_Chr10g8100 [Amborella trichopoda]